MLRHGRLRCSLLRLLLLVIHFRRHLVTIGHAIRHLLLLVVPVLHLRLAVVLRLRVTENEFVSEMQEAWLLAV